VHEPKKFSEFCGNSREVSPDLPTMVEAGFPGFDATAWFALLAPAGTPEPIIAKLHREAVRILTLPGVRKRFDALGMVPMGHLARAVRRRYRVGDPLWAKVIKTSGAKLAD
jgi:tripartite-type tricarboxylate transporter receptor subunit TctC